MQLKWLTNQEVNVFTFILRNICGKIPQSKETPVPVLEDLTPIPTEAKPAPVTCFSFKVACLIDVTMPSDCPKWHHKSCPSCHYSL